MNAPPPCTAAQLTAYDGGAKSYGNRFVTTIVLTNGSAETCTISGYPKLAFLFSNGSAENVTVRFTEREENFTARPPSTIKVQPSQRVAFMLGYPKPGTHGHGCDTVSTIEIQGFPQRGTLQLPESIYPCPSVNVSPYFRK